MRNPVSLHKKRKAEHKRLKAGRNERLKSKKYLSLLCSALRFLWFSFAHTCRIEHFCNLTISSISDRVFRLCAEHLAKRRSALSFSTRRSVDTRPAPIRDRVWSQPRTVRWPRLICLL